jgi:hypothetical protein
MHGFADSCDHNLHIATHSNSLGDVLQVLNYLYDFLFVMFVTEQRTSIKFSVRLGKTIAEIHKMLCVVTVMRLE